MLSYKNWKTLNESYGPAITLGIKTPNVVGGVMGSHLEPELDEAKKCKDCKKMLGNEPLLGKIKMKMKPKLGAKPELGEKPEDDEIDLKDKIDDDEPVDDDEIDEPTDDDEIDDEVPDEEPGDEEEIDIKKPSLDKIAIKTSSKKSTKKASKKASKKMTAEESQWWNSVHSMLNVNDIDKKYWDGYREDVLFNPIDPNAELAQEPTDPANPQPGTVGYAPQTRIGGF